MSDKTAQPEPLPVNRRPVNQLCLKFLRLAKEHPNPLCSYLLQLLRVGFERNVPLPGPGGGLYRSLEVAAGQRCSTRGRRRTGSTYRT